MKKFNYKYESLKKTKEIFGKKIQKEISEIDLQLQDLLSEIDKKNSEIQLCLENSKEYSRIAEIVAAEQFRNSLISQIKQLRVTISSLEEIKKQKQKDLVSRNQEVKIFQTLENIHQQNFLNIENKLEENLLNEIGIQKYIKGKSE